MLLREIVLGRRSEFPWLAKASGFDFLCFPDQIEASIHTKLALREGIDIRVSEAITQVFDQPGGIIVFSVDVNVTDAKRSLRRIKDFVASKWQSIANRLFRYQKIDRAAQQADPKKHEIQGLSIGRFFRGRYYRAQTGEIFNETSLSVEVIGISTEMLLAFATALAAEFNQETVLVKDYATNRIYLTDRHPTSLLDSAIAVVRKRLPIRSTA